MLGQDLGELRQCLLGAVFLVAADQDDVLPLAGPFAPLVNDPRVVGPGGARRTSSQAKSANQIRASLIMKGS